MSVSNTVTSLTSIIRSLIKDRIESDGNDVFQYSTDNSFSLSEPFIDDTSFIVYQNGNVISSSDYSYNADTNQLTIVFITSGSSLTTGDIIRVTYNYYKKYSDTEIRGFLESSLAYFVQHRYKKVFEITDDIQSGSSQILALDGTDPTTSELYFIALIASILIDPQNITVDVDGSFKLEANRETSDQEQISKAFAQFKRFVGKVDFELLETDIKYDTN